MASGAVTRGRRAVCRRLPGAALLLLLAGAQPAAAAQPSVGCAADTVVSGRALSGHIDVGGVSRTYVLDVPPSVRAHAPAPLVFDFHGFGGSGTRVSQYSAFRPLAARDGFIVVYPNGLPVHLLGRDAPGWEIFHVARNRDLAFTRALLARLQRAYCIDDRRIYATGFSNGAFFSNLLGCTMADRFAAIAPVSGGRITVPCAPARAVPVLIHHGREDQIVPVAQARRERDVWLHRNGCSDQYTRDTGGCDVYTGCRDGSVVGYCEGEWRHQWPPAAAARIWDFFRAHPLPVPALPLRPAAR